VVWNVTWWQNGKMIWGGGTGACFTGILFCQSETHQPRSHDQRLLSVEVSIVALNKTPLL